MKWFKNNITLSIAIFLVASVVIGAGVQQQFPTDILKMGVGSSSDDKQIIIDTGDGAGNPSIVIDMTNKDFDFNKALNIVDDLLKLGSGAAADQVVEFDIGAASANPKFKWDNTQQSLAFANDGVNFKKLGSGSGSGGGGTNVLAESNFDFETADPPQDWTASGGTFSAETSAPLFGEQSGLWDSNGLGQTLDSVLAPITTGFLGSNCQIALDYLYPVGTDGDYKIVVRQFDDSGATEITVLEQDVRVSSARVPFVGFFTCPDDVADDLRVRIESTVADADPITIDNVFIGTGRNTLQGVPKNTVETNILTGNITSPGVATDLTFSNLEIGANYEILGNLYMVQDSGAASDGVIVLIQDGSNVLARKALSVREASDTISDAVSIPISLTYVATSTTLTFEVQGVTANDFLEGDGTLQRTFVQLEKRNDLQSGFDDAITLETSGFLIRASIFGANPILGTTNDTNFNLIQNGSLEIAPNAYGSSQGNPRIVCAPPEAPTGTSCSGDEQVGVNFDIPTAGDYKACWQFAHGLRGGTPGVAFQDFRVRETTANSNTELRSFSVNGTIMGNSDDYQGTAITHCDIINWDTPGNKTLRLSERTNLISGSITTNQINGGSRDIMFTVEKLTEQKPTPIFTDLQNSLKDKVNADFHRELQHVVAAIGNTGTPTIVGDLNNGTSWISGLVDVGVGATRIEFESGVFDGVFAPVCVCSSNSNAINCITTARLSDSVQVNTVTSSTGAVADAAFTIMCSGAK
jgi:hypothetical protein